MGGGRRRTSAWRMGGPGVAGAAACAGGGPGVAGVGPGAAAGAAAGPGVAGAAAGAAAADAPSRRPPQDAGCGVRGGGPGTCTAAAGGAARAGSVRDASAWLGGRAAAVGVGRGRASPSAPTRAAALRPAASGEELQFRPASRRSDWRPRGRRDVSSGLLGFRATP